MNPSVPRVIRLEWLPRQRAAKTESYLKIWLDASDLMLSGSSSLQMVESRCSPLRKIFDWQMEVPAIRLVPSLLLMQFGCIEFCD